MVEAYSGEVVGASGFCSPYCGAVWPVVGNVGREPFAFDPSTSSSISSAPLLPDPYEGHFARGVAGAAPGVYAASPVLAGTVVAFYNGVRAAADDEEEDDEDEREEAGLNRVALTEDLDLTVPLGDRDTGSYCASLGHKVVPNNIF